MEQTLIHTSDPVGVGLAAPQVGLSLQLFLARPTEDGKIYHFINPTLEILDESKKKSKKKQKEDNKLLEGCLSIPNIWGHVTRPMAVKLSYQDWNGKKYTQVYDDFMSTIIQHEVDHLNGILFTKHVLAQREKLYKSYKNSDGEEEFEEIRL